MLAAWIHCTFYYLCQTAQFSLAKRHPRQWKLPKTEASDSKMAMAGCSLVKRGGTTCIMVRSSCVDRSPSNGEAFAQLSTHKRRVCCGCWATVRFPAGAWAEHVTARPLDRRQRPLVTSGGCRVFPQFRANYYRTTTRAPRISLLQRLGRREAGFSLGASRIATAQKTMDIASTWQHLR